MECSSNLVTARVIVINVLPDRGIDTDLAARKWKKINYSGTWTSFKFVRINIIFFSMRGIRDAKKDMQTNSHKMGVGMLEITFSGSCTFLVIV